VKTAIGTKERLATPHLTLLKKKGKASGLWKKKEWENATFSIEKKIGNDDLDGWKRRKT